NRPKLADLTQLLAKQRLKLVLANSHSPSIVILRLAIEIRQDLVESLTILGKTERRRCATNPCGGVPFISEWKRKLCRQLFSIIAGFEVWDYAVVPRGSVCLDHTATGLRVPRIAQPAFERQYSA